MNKKQVIRINESQLRQIVTESVKRVLKESDYNDYFDWADNSDASDEEKEIAGIKHDERIGSIYDEPDYLAQKQDEFDRFSKRKERGEMSPSEFSALKKYTMKNHRSGGKMATDRLTKALTQNRRW